MVMMMMIMMDKLPFVRWFVPLGRVICENTGQTQLDGERNFFPPFVPSLIYLSSLFFLVISLDRRHLLATFVRTCILRTHVNAAAAAAAIVGRVFFLSYFQSSTIHFGHHVASKRHARPRRTRRRRKEKKTSIRSCFINKSKRNASRRESYR